MSKVVCRISKLSSMSKIGKASKHNLRLEQDSNREHIDHSKGHTLLVGSNNAFDDVKNRLDTATKNANGKFRSNAVLAVEMILSASPEYFSSQEKLDQWTEKNLAWLKKEYGDNLVNVVLHEDEQTPHLHILIVPIDNKNKLNCREFFGGKEKLKELQTKSYLAVKELGIERGTPKDITGATHTKTAEWRKEKIDLDNDMTSLKEAVKNIEPIETNFTGLIKASNADEYYKEKAIENIKKSTPAKLKSLTQENKELKKYNYKIKEDKSKANTLLLDEVDKNKKLKEQNEEQMEILTELKNSLRILEEEKNKLNEEFEKSLKLQEEESFKKYMEGKKDGILEEKEKSISKLNHIENTKRKDKGLALSILNITEKPKSLELSNDNKHTKIFKKSTDLILSR